MVRGVDAAPSVGYLENRKAELGAAAHRDFAGAPGLEVFERIVDQIGEDLLQRKAIADDIRQRVEPDLGLGVRGLMRDGHYDTLDQLPGVDPDRLELAPSLAGEAEDRR